MKNPKHGTKADKAEDKKNGERDTMKEDMAEMKKKKRPAKTIMHSMYR